MRAASCEVDQKAVSETTGGVLRGTWQRKSKASTKGQGREQQKCNTKSFSMKAVVPSQERPVHHLSRRHGTKVELLKRQTGGGLNSFQK